MVAPAAVLGRRPACAPPLISTTRVDRRLANKNIRTGLIAGAISLIVFGASFFVGFIY